MNIVNLVLCLPSLSIGIFPLLAIFGSLQALLEYRRNIRNTTGRSLEQVISFGQGVFSLIFSSLSGSLLVAVLLGQQPTWIYNNGVILTFISIFSLQYFKKGLLISICEQHVISRLIIASVDTISYGFAITSFGVDIALNSLGNKRFSAGAILCGLTSGIGSQLVKETFHLFDKDWYFSTPVLFMKNDQYLSPMIHTSLWSSVIYYLGLRWNLMRPETWKAINVILLGIYNSRQQLSFAVYILTNYRNKHLNPLNPEKKLNIFFSILNTIGSNRIISNEEQIY